MKKLLSIIIVLALALSVPFASFAAKSGPASSYEPRPDTDKGAWSYIKVSPVNGDRSRTHYVFSNYETTTLPIEGKVEKVKGLSYNKKTNTLTLSKYKEEDIILQAHNMGTGFSIKLSGKNKLRSIKIDNEHWDSGLTITGSGSVTVGGESDHYNIALDVYGDMAIESGSVTVLPEVTEMQITGGIRNSLMVRGTSAYPLTTALKVKGAVEVAEAATGNTTVARSTEKITFSGKAISKIPSVKRSGKKIGWKKISGCKYEVKVGKKTKTVKSTSYKTKSKAAVRAFKVKNGIKYVSSWSKRK